MTRTQLEELAKRLDAVEHAEREVSLGMDMDPLKTANHRYAETCKEAAAAIRELLAQEPVAMVHMRVKPPWQASKKVVDLLEKGHDLPPRTPLYAAPVPAVDQIVGPFDSVDDLIAALPGPAVDLAEWKTEAMRLVDELMSECRQTGEAEPGSRYYDLTGPEKERKLRAALQSHLDKIGGK
jgi:hypothetical protein